MSQVLDEHEEEEEDEFVVDLFHHPLSYPHKYGVINRSMKIYQPDADSVLSIPNPLFLFSFHPCKALQVTNPLRLSIN